MSAPAKLPAEPHLTEDDGNLVVYRLGPCQYIGHHVGLNAWNVSSSVTSARVWYECREAKRRKEAAGLCENAGTHERSMGSRERRRLARQKVMQRYWIRRPWVGSNGRWLMRAWV